jgi:hypothetical protein
MHGASMETSALDTVVAAVQIVFYLSPLIIAGATLFLAWWRFKVFRVREPAIKMDLTVTSRRCSPSYYALNAVATLTNTSRVAVEITRLEWAVRILSPYDDDDVEDMISDSADFQLLNDTLDFPWAVYNTLIQEGVMLSLDPMESNAIGMAIAIPDSIESVEVLIELDSPSEQDEGRLYWIARCPHDINQEA